MAIRYHSELIDFRGSDRYPASGRALPVSDRHAYTFCQKMSAPSPPVPSLEIPERLGYLIEYCEKSCVAECCGVDAFHFSPLHIASFISGSSGAINEAELGTWNGLIDEFESNFRALQSPQEGGFACVISPMNQLFTEEAFAALIAELRTSLAAAPAVLELSNQLETPTKAWKVMKEFSDQNRAKLT